jgi:hypothetical protein
MCESEVTINAKEWNYNYEIAILYGWVIELIVVGQERCELLGFNYASSVIKFVEKCFAMADEGPFVLQWNYVCFSLHV